MQIFIKVIFSLCYKFVGLFGEQKKTYPPYASKYCAMLKRNVKFTTLIKLSLRFVKPIFNG